ncbi:MAG: hypothetical protein ACR2LZ_11885 [Pyrinomonadaceae bacterium]
MPSDLVRTEYINVDAHFPRSLKDFLISLDERAEYYQTLAIAFKKMFSDVCPEGTTGD